MASTTTISRRQSSAITLPTLKLARWQVRQTWRLLLVTCFGIIIAVTLVCAVPLYSRVAMTAELRGFFRAVPPASSLANSEIEAQSATYAISIDATNNVRRQLDQELQKQLGPYLAGPAQFSIETRANTLMQQDPRHPNDSAALVPTNNQLELIGASMQSSASRVKLLAGRLPQPQSNNLEIAITPDTASEMQARPGSVIYVSMFSYFGPNPQQAAKIPANVALHVVGIFTPVDQHSDNYWHQESFEPDISDNAVFKGLMSNDTYLSLFNNLNQKYPDTGFKAQPLFDWYYRIDASRIDISDLDPINNGIHNVLADVSGTPSQQPFLVNTKSVSPAADAIANYSNRISVVTIPVTSLSFLVVGLIVFFVSMMTDIVVDRQTDAIAILRSRGASRRQIFGSLLAQSIVLCVIALIIGPLLAIGMVYLLAQTTLSALDQQALNIIPNLPWQIAQTLAVYGLITVLVAIGAMIISLVRAANQGVVSARHEAGRSTNRPLWQRMSLDVIAAIIALTSFAFAFYVSGPGVLDTQVRVLILPPLTLAGVIFLLIGLTLLFLRFFPKLLQGIASVVARGRSATPMLALAQMARAPRQSLRMTMLLAFSIAFAMFTLMFTATQSQRITDVANYQVGSDFSGTITGSASVVKSSTYARIPGVISATTGYIDFPRASQTNIDASVELRAVDASTYANTVIWNDAYSSQSIFSLMKQLVAKRINSVTTDAVPVIIDTTAAQTLHLSVGSNVTLSDVNGDIGCVVIAEVNRIPTVNDSTEATGTSNYFAYGGFLADFTSYANAFLAANNRAIPTNTAWLRTRSDAKLLASVRTTLNSGPLSLDNLNDRRLVESNLRNDPLYIDLVGVLLLGAAVAMVLALVGNLIASWLSVRSRLTSFAVLRALGTAPRQIASIITWEQAIIYATSLIIGVIFGLILALLALPSLVFTNIAISGLHSDITNGEFFILQRVPDIAIVFPNTLLIALAVLILICILALGMMMRVASRPSISQTLRLNED